MLRQDTGANVYVHTDLLNRLWQDWRASQQHHLNNIFLKTFVRVSLLTDMENKQTDDHEHTSEKGCVNVRNPYLNCHKKDNLYHIAINTRDHDIPALFSDVKFVCFGGQTSRMEIFINMANEELGLAKYDHVPVNHAHATDRYCAYKAGPVLAVSHGIGVPSLSVVFNEIVKLMFYAGCEDVRFFRMGTCGGLGLEPGTVVLTEKAVDGELNDKYKLCILGKCVERPAIVDMTLVEELEACASKEDGYQTVRGTTMCADDFYEAQARVDGAFCDYTEEDKMKFLHQLRDSGVSNIEMESLGFLAMCHHAGVRGAVACTTLVDRLQSDFVSKEYAKFMMRAPKLVLRYIKKNFSFP